MYCQVGVGTTTPITLFQVNGDSSTSNGISLRATQDYDAIGISHNGTVGFLNVAGADNGFSLRVSGSNTGTILSQTYNEALRILPNGNVGVGTNSPVAKLEVNGDLKVNNVPVLVDIENSRLLMVDINGNVKQISLSNLANQINAVSNCNNTISVYNNVPSTPVQICNFGGATNGNFFVTLNLYTPCYGTTAQFKLFVDLTLNKIYVDEYRHFNGIKYYGNQLSGNGTTIVTGINTFSYVEVSLIGDILNLRQISNPCGSSLNLTGGCFSNTF